jgi:hypothetical protein
VNHPGPHRAAPAAVSVEPLLRHRGPNFLSAAGVEPAPGTVGPAHRFIQRIYGAGTALHPLMELKQPSWPLTPISISIFVLLD